MIEAEAMWDGIWLGATLAAPLLLLAVSFLIPAQALKKLLPLAPLPALIAAVFLSEGAFIAFPDMLFGLVLYLDAPGSLLLGASAILWMAAGVYANAYRRKTDNDTRFVRWWLATLTGSLGVFIAADLPGFYLFFTMVSLSAYWLIVDDGTASVRRAGLVYVSLALLGEAFLLFAFVLLAVASLDGSLLIYDAMVALPSSPFRDIVIVLVILGFGIKIGLVPLHVWMPLTYRAAPVPVAAVLSGAAVKAGVIGLIRFLPFEAAMPEWGMVLAVLGLVSVFYGVAIGLTQSHPKTILAYSSISQMGVIATVMGMGLASGNTLVPILAAFYGLHHILVKGGLFLALGIATQHHARGLWPVMLPAVIIALGLGGLPLTGGMVAKLAIKEPLGDGLAGLLIALSGATSTLLMLHFLSCLRHASEQGDAVATSVTGSAALVGSWLVVAACAIALPWLLFPVVTGEPLLYALAPQALLESLWPVLLGAGLAFAGRRMWHVLPSIPPGDILAGVPFLIVPARRIGCMMERIDGYLRQWPVATIAFLVCTILFALLIAGR